LLFAAAVIIFTGGIAERRFLIVLMICVFSTYAVNATLGWMEAQPYITGIDTALLLMTLAWTAKTTCYWPIWFSAFQAIAVATSFAQLLFPNHVPTVYIAVQGFWFLPALASMAAGAMLDRRARRL
jgi:hypothetical protein